MSDKTDLIAENIKAHICKLSENKDRFIVGIDGRCASGKTTVGKKLAKMLCAGLIHIDDFYLPVSKRCENWKEKIAGNIDFNRIKSEILDNIMLDKEYIYRAYSCCDGKYKDGVHNTPSKITIIEGSYSLHPSLAHYYNLTVFMDVDTETQLERIKKRNGESQAAVFSTLWIPLEERYLSSYNIIEKCDMYYKT